MPNYIRQPGDKSYRKVPLGSNYLPEFTDFQSSNQTVTYSSEQVLEISCDSGENKLVYDLDPNGPGKQTLSYAVTGNKISIFGNVHIERLWLTDGSEMLYKLPANLPIENGQYYFQMPEMTGSVSIVGDKYFEKAYDRG